MLLTSGRIRIYHLCSIAVTGYCNLPGGKSGNITFSLGDIAFAGKGKTGNLEVVTPSA
jgi:hypothetical protein